MQNLTVTQLTESDIRAAVRSELEAFFTEHALTTQQSEPDQIGGIELAQNMTGLAKATIYGLVSQSKIPFMKKGKKLYFSKQDLTEWIKAGKRKTTSDIEAEASDYISEKDKHLYTKRRATR